jgi:hypothetical protein
MDGKSHTLRLVGFLAAALATALIVIPFANAGRHPSQRDQDGWYYTALRGNSASPARADSPVCQTNRTFDQAARSGALPSIVAALQGSTGITEATSC